MTRREPPRTKWIDLRCIPGRAPCVALAVMFLLVGCNMPGLEYVDVAAEHVAPGTCGHGDIIVSIEPNQAADRRAIDVQVRNLRNDEVAVSNWFVVHGDAPSEVSDRMSVGFRSFDHQGSWFVAPRSNAEFIVMERDFTRSDRLGNWMSFNFTYHYEVQGEPFYRVSCDIAGDGMADP